jgi:hypothetical protein
MTAGVSSGGDRQIVPRAARFRAGYDRTAGGSWRAGVDQRGAINAEFGLFSSPFSVEGVWVGWGKAIRKRLGEEATGRQPVGEIAKGLARDLRAG